MISPNILSFMIKIPFPSSIQIINYNFAINKSHSPPFYIHISKFTLGSPTPLFWDIKLIFQIPTLVIIQIILHSKFINLSLKKGWFFHILSLQTYKSIFRNCSSLLKMIFFTSKTQFPIQSTKKSVRTLCSPKMDGKI